MSKTDVFGDLADAARKFSDPNLGAMTEIVALRGQVTLLLEENKKLRNDRRQWFMLLAAILKQHGDMRVAEHTRVALEKPVITVADDPATGGIVVRLKP